MKLRIYFNRQNIMKNPEILNVLRKIFNEPNASQRKLASELNLSLGKLNYIVSSLRNKGLIKVKNFKNNKHKINYIYLLTPSGISYKTRLTINYMKKLSNEYEALKKDLKNNE